MNKARQHI